AAAFVAGGRVKVALAMDRDLRSGGGHDWNRGATAWSGVAAWPGWRLGRPNGPKMACLSFKIS
ncbi:hypothetical protein ACJX0J_032759, partial [Zea mays]